MKSFYFSKIAVAAISAFIIQCHDQMGITDQNAVDISYNYHESLGCLENNVLTKTNNHTEIKWNYFAGYLNLEFQFKTNCAAVLKDSVVSSDGLIKIFLKDTNPIGALCTCPFKETFGFYIQNPGRIKICFYFKQFAAIDYNLVADTTIHLN